MRVLLLSINAGQGHTRCAQAIMRALRARDVRSVLIDALAYANPVVGELLGSAYARFSLSGSALLGASYRMMLDRRMCNVRRAFAAAVGRSMRRRLAALIAAYRPDALVCTHVYAALSAGYALERLHSDVPLIGVNTDYALAPFWEDAGVDLLVLADPALEAEACARGIDRQRLLSCGIPVDERFDAGCTPAQMRARLGLPPLPALLMMGGGLGYGELEWYTRQLDRLPGAFQVLAVCGENEALYQRLRAFSAHSSKPISVYPFVENVHELMAAADILMTKPGGLTLSEALTCGASLILLDPIPGIEQANALFLAARGLALPVPPRTSPAEFAQELLCDPERVARLRGRRRPDASAARTVAERIIRLAGG